MYKVTFEKDAFSDMQWWAKEQPKMVNKILELIEIAAKTPLTGLGKPEPLKGNLKSYWSRRITDEHRLIYKVSSEEIIVVSAKGHYN